MQRGHKKEKAHCLDNRFNYYLFDFFLPFHHLSFFFIFFDSFSPPSFRLVPFGPVLDRRTRLSLRIQHQYQLCWLSISFFEKLSLLCRYVFIYLFDNTNAGHAVMDACSQALSALS